MKKLLNVYKKPRKNNSLYLLASLKEMTCFVKAVFEIKKDISVRCTEISFPHYASLW